VNDDNISATISAANISSILSDIYGHMRNMFIASLTCYKCRKTDYFPIREVTFNCRDAEISHEPEHSTYSQFAYAADVPYEAVIIVAFCLPPFIVSTVTQLYSMYMEILLRVAFQPDCLAVGSVAYPIPIGAVK